MGLNLGASVGIGVGKGVGVKVGVDSGPPHDTIAMVTRTRTPTINQHFIALIDAFDILLPVTPDRDSLWSMFGAPFRGYPPDEQEEATSDITALHPISSRVAVASRAFAAPSLC